MRELYDKLATTCASLALPTEFIFVDDGSTDGSQQILRELTAGNPDCRVIIFRRNCGKSAALQAGFQAARGAYLLTLDADLQDDPTEIPRFLDALQRADMVVGWKVQRQDPLSKTLPSRLFNAAVREVTGSALHDMNCGFKGFRREVVDELPLYGGLYRFLPVFAAARGYRVEELPVTHHPRRFGASKFGPERFLQGIYDLLTVVYLAKYRTRPLHFFGNLGLSFLLIAIIFGVSLSLALYSGTVRPTTWHFLLWMVTGSLFTLGPVCIAIGIVAEGQLAHLRQHLPPLPVAERLNMPATHELPHAR